MVEQLSYDNYCLNVFLIAYFFENIFYVFKCIYLALDFF